MEKKLYVAPETEDIKIEMCSVICDSGGAGGGSEQGGGDPLHSLLYYDIFIDYKESEKY